MKKVLLFFVLALSINLIFASPAAIEPRKKIYASDIIIPLGVTGQKISLLDISKLTIKEAEIVRGEKMKFSERVAFKAAQRKLKQYINPDGSLNDHRLIKKLKKTDKKLRNAEGDGGFHAGGFFLGLILGLIGLIIALLINDDKKKARIKWALIGWGIWIAIVLIAYAA
jgi:hypothetical protein